MIDFNNRLAPFSGAHKEGIYRALERDAKATNNPILKSMFDTIWDWDWRGNIYCLFCKLETLRSPFLRSTGLPELLSDFAHRHQIQIDLRPLGS
jgi:hypothetical protein